MDAALREQIGGHAAPLDVRAWRRAAHNALRSDPAMPLEKALARGWVAAHGPADPARTLIRAEELLAGKPQPAANNLDHDPSYSLNELFLAADGLYAGSNKGLFKKTARGLELIEITRGRIVEQILERDGELLVGTDKGLFARDKNGRWTEPFPLKTLGSSPSVYGIAYFQGKWVLATSMGIFAGRSGRWRKLAKFGAAGRLVVYKSSLYVIPPQKIHPGRDFYTYWRFDDLSKAPKELQFDVQSLNINVHDVAVFGGKLCIGMNKGLVSFDGKEWRLDFKDASVYSFSEDGGRLLAATSEALWRLEGGRWSVLLPASGLRRAIVVDDKIHLIRWNDGTLYHAPTAFWPDSWRESVLEKLSRLKASAPAAAALGGSKSGGPISLKDRRGRSLLGGAKRIASSLIARLGGALGFGGVRRLGRVPPSAAPWRFFARALKARHGIEVDVAAWRREAAGALRGRPDMPLERLLLDALARVEPSIGEKADAENLLQLLAGRPALMRAFPRHESVSSIASWGGRLYAGTWKHLHAFSGKRWSVEAPGPVYKLAPLRGRLHAAAGGAGLLRLGGPGRWEKLPTPDFYVKNFWDIGGVLHAGDEEGDDDETGATLWKEDPKAALGWRDVGDFNDRRKARISEMAHWGGQDFIVVDDTLYARSRERPSWTPSWLPNQAGVTAWSRVDQLLPAENELYALREGVLFKRGESGWTRLPLSGAKPNRLFYSNGRLYARAEDGLYLRDGLVWQKISSLRNVQALAEFEGNLILGKGDKLYRLRVGEAEPPPGWREALLSDLAEAAATPKPVGAPPGLLKDRQGRSLLGSAKRAASSFIARLGGRLGFEGETARPAEQTPPAEDIWRILDGYLRGALHVQETLPEAWREEAAKILRNRPELELLSLLARSFARTYGLAAASEGVLRSLLGGEALPIPGPQLERVAWWRGRLYAADSTRVFILEGAAWRELPMPSHDFAIHDLAAAQDRLHVPTSRGLLVFDGERWEAALSGVSIGPVHQENGRPPSAASEEGRVYSLRDGRWKTPAELRGAPPAPWPAKRALRFEDRWFAATHKELYAFQGGRWIPVPVDTAGRHLWINDLQVHGNTLYLAASEGLYALRRGRSTKVAEGLGQVFALLVVRGALHLGTSSGLHRLQDGRAKLLSPLDWARSLAASPDALYAAGNGSLAWEIRELPAGLPEGWRSSLLNDLADHIASGLKSRPPRGPRGGFFSWLFGLLLSWLSGPPMAFPRTTAPGAWEALADRLTRRLGAEAADAATWRLEAAKALRGQPEKSLEAVLARSFNDTHPSAEKAGPDLIRNIFSKLEPLRLPGLELPVRHAARLGGVLYAAAQGGVYMRSGRKWIRILAVPDARHVALAQGRLYVSTASGLYERRGRAFERVPLPGAPEVFSVAALRRRLFVATSEGLFIKRPRGWEKTLDKRVYAVREHGGKLYAHTRLGYQVFNDQNAVWEPGWIQSDMRFMTILRKCLFAVNAEGLMRTREPQKTRNAQEPGEHHLFYILRNPAVHHAADIGGTLYIGAEDGLYLIRPGETRLTPVLRGVPVHHIEDDGGKPLIATDAGLWRMPGPADADLSPEFFLQDLARQAEAAGKRAGPRGGPSLKDRRGRSLL